MAKRTQNIVMKAPIIQAGERPDSRIYRLAESNKHASDDNCAAPFQRRKVAGRMIATHATAIPD
jgi:hypothetical protein